jgi:DNA invertase Pin-like site-specific DNA recombinase
VKHQAVAYYRVSTSEQGRSGLGLEAQKHAVSVYVASAGLDLILEVEEIESGKRNDRPELLRAIAYAKRCKALLVIAKLDRLSRSVAFVSTLMEAGVRFVAADQPTATELSTHILIAVAQAERKAIGERTRAALAAARARGTRLGNPRLDQARPLAIAAVRDTSDRFAQITLPLVRDLQNSGCRTLQSIADALNMRGVKTARSGAWTATRSVGFSLGPCTPRRANKSAGAIVTTGGQHCALDSCKRSRLLREVEDKSNRRLQFTRQLVQAAGPSCA